MTTDICPPPQKKNLLGEIQDFKCQEGVWGALRRSGHWRALRRIGHWRGTGGGFGGAELAGTSREEGDSGDDEGLEETSGDSGDDEGLDGTSRDQGGLELGSVALPGPNGETLALSGLDRGTGADTGADTGASLGVKIGAENSGGSARSRSSEMHARADFGTGVDLTEYPAGTRRTGVCWDSSNWDTQAFYSTSPTMNDEPSNNSTWSIYCAREPGVVAAGAWRKRRLSRPLQKTTFNVPSFQATWWASWRNSST